jgi:tight adherence protein C
MFENLTFYLIPVLTFFLVMSFLYLLYELLNAKRLRIRPRLEGLSLKQVRIAEDILDRPFRERTLMVFSKWLAASAAKVTPVELTKRIDSKLERAGRPQNMKAIEFLIVEGLIALVMLLFCVVILRGFHYSFLINLVLTLGVILLSLAIPWLLVTRIELKRTRSIRKSLPDIMDLIVVSVEAGLSLDMALTKVVEKYKGFVAQEFQRVIRDIQLGKPRKEAFKDMTDRVKIEELSSLVNAIVQSEQLGVGLGYALRIQADLIREKRQQWIEAQAMKAPIKMLFPLVFCIFPCMFIIILGPALITLIKALRGV